jgi:serine/threonine protein phosphatase PrpC
MTIKAEGKTDIGKKRGHNEDSFGVYPELGLYVVADGMGGHAAGEVASLTAVKTIKEFIATATGPEGATWPFERDSVLPDSANRLVVGVKVANRAVMDLARTKPELKGMGTTIVAAFTDGDALYMAHVGDSRAYLLSKETLKQITVDHSFVEEQVQAGVLTHEQARHHPFRNVITRALGVKEDVKVDISQHPLNKGDLYLLCSDGLSGMLSEYELDNIIKGRIDDLPALVETLIRRANEKGGDDNITAVVVKVA